MSDYKVEELKKIKNNEAWRKKYISDRQAALGRLLKLRDFRFYISDVLGFSGTFENTFDEKGNVSAFNTGKHAVGIKIFNEIMLEDPSAYITMLNEEKRAIEEKESFIDNNGTK